MYRVTIDTLEQLAESQISVGGWGEEIKLFFETSLDAAGQTISRKFEIENDIDKAVERVADGNFAYYENIFFLRHASVHKKMLILGNKKFYFFLKVIFLNVNDDFCSILL